MRRPPTALGLIAAVLAVAVTTALIYPLSEAVPVVSTGIVYLIAVLLVSSRWGLWPGVLTAVLGAAAWNFFHLPPTGEFEIADGENWVALVVFMVAAVVTSTLAERARSRAEEAERGKREADLTAEMARLLLGGASEEQPLRTVGQRIAQAYDLPSVSVELSWVDSDSRRWIRVLAATRAPGLALVGAARRRPRPPVRGAARRAAARPGAPAARGAAPARDAARRRP